MILNKKETDRDIRTLLSPLLLGTVDVVFELNANLPLVGLVSDEGVLQELLRRGALRVVLHQTALDETKKLFGPLGIAEEEQGVNREKQCVAERVTYIKGDSGCQTNISAMER